MKRFTITIRWRCPWGGEYRWTLQGIARSSCDLVLGLIDEFPPGSFVTVRPR